MNYRLHWNGPLLVSTITLLLIAGYLIFSLTGVLGAAFTGQQNAAAATDAMEKLLARHDEDQNIYLARYQGRSLFFIPRKTPPKYIPPLERTRPQPAPVEHTPAPPSKPPPPPNYTGPPPIAIIGNTVWFRLRAKEDPVLKVPLGEEREGLKVLSLNPPYSLRVAYTNNEYDLELFSRGLEELNSSLSEEEVKPAPVPTSPDSPASLASPDSPSRDYLRPENKPASSDHTVPRRSTIPPHDGMLPSAPARKRSTTDPRMSPAPMTPPAPLQKKRDYSPVVPPRPADPDRPPPPLEPVDG